MNTALIYRDYYFTEACPRLQNVLDGKPGLACIARRRSRTLELGDNAGRLCVPRLRRHGVVSSQFLAERNAVLEQREFRLLLDFL